MKFIEVENILEGIRYQKGNNIIITDIDDCVLQANPDVIKIYKTFNGGPETALTTAQYATDKDKGKPGYKFDIREFRDPQKVYDSIVKGVPKIKNLRILDSYISANYKLAFLTARGLEEVVASALSNFLLYKNKDGKLTKLPDEVFKRDMSHAVNDDKYGASLGSSDPEKKANILKNACSKYDRVVFIDDDKNNVKAARNLNLPNLKVIQAWV